jgi:hypothetical protein
MVQTWQQLRRQDVPFRPHSLLVLTSLYCRVYYLVGTLTTFYFNPLKPKLVYNKYLRIQSVLQREHHASPLHWLILIKEIIPVYSESYATYKYALSA